MEAIKAHDVLEIDTTRKEESGHFKMSKKMRKDIGKICKKYNINTSNFIRAGIQHFLYSLNVEEERRYKGGKYIGEERLNKNKEEYLFCDSCGMNMWEEYDKWCEEELLFPDILTLNRDFPGYKCEHCIEHKK